MPPCRPLVVLAGLAALATAACRSASEGSPAADVARVAADVASRTGSSPPAGGDPDAACRAILAGPLTEEGAVKLALLRNASVREAYERLGVARADLLQAGLVSNPVYAASRKAFPTGPEVELSLAQSFVDLFFMPLRRRVAGEALCAAQAEVARDLVHLVHGVRREFARLRGAAQVEALRREALAAALASRDLVRTLHEAGNARDADLTVAEIGAVRAELEADGAGAARRDAREAMNVLLGLRPPDTSWRVEGDLPPLPPAAAGADVEPRALAGSLDLLATRARIAASLAGAGLARRQGLLPVLDLGAVGKRESADGAWGFGPEVTAAIPVFDHGQARALAADAEARGLVAREEQLTVEVAAAARRLADRARALRERERRLRETALPLRARLVEDVARAYNAMQVGAFDVLAAREAQADARREHVETLVAAWVAEIDLAELLAGSLPRDRLDDLRLPEPAERPAPPKGS